MIEVKKGPWRQIGYILNIDRRRYLLFLFVGLKVERGRIWLLDRLLQVLLCHCYRRRL